MYTCSYCGKYLSVIDNFVEVCQCPESLLEEQSLKERARQLIRKTKQTFEEARQCNKVPIRKK